VEDFFEWHNLRGAAEGKFNIPTRTETKAWPDALCNNIKLFFIHGFKVSEKDAVAWNSRLFKALHQSGSNARYCAVTWHSKDMVVLPDYHQNVKNAFRTVYTFTTTLIQARTGQYSKIGVFAHSLGNMVVRPQQRGRVRGVRREPAQRQPAHQQRAQPAGASPLAQPANPDARVCVAMAYPLAGH
jgi:hypothetical protein